MFGDLDWPLNASRGLSAIAEFPVDKCSCVGFHQSLESDELQFGFKQGKGCRDTIFTPDSDWGCFRGCAISSSLGAPF